MAFLSSSRIQTLATSMEHELADYDLWIDEVRAQLLGVALNEVQTGTRGGAGGSVARPYWFAGAGITSSPGRACR